MEKVRQANDRRIERGVFQHLAEIPEAFLWRIGGLEEYAALIVEIGTSVEMRLRKSRHHPRMLLARPAGADDTEIPFLLSLRPLHSATFPRSFFNVERFRFVSRMRRFNARGRGEF